MSVSGSKIKCIVACDDYFTLNTDLSVDIINGDDVSVSDCFEIRTEVVSSDPIIVELNDCGCEVYDCNPMSLKITVGKKTNNAKTCDYTGFALDSGGYVLFTFPNGVKTFTIDSECCTALSFTYESDVQKCRWGKLNAPVTVPPSNPCEGYTALKADLFGDGYMFFSGPMGEITQIVPSAECCPLGYPGERQSDGTYKCKYSRL